MNFWHTWSLTRRATTLFSVLVFVIMSSLGMYLYTSARQALEQRADYTLIGRVEHFRTLFRDLYNIQQMEAHPTLFESMLGNEQDVRIFRRLGDAPFINVNPGAMSPPAMKPVDLGVPLTLGALQDGKRDDGVRVRWVAALAEVGNHKDKVEIIAAYVMTQESAVLSTYLLRVIAAVALTVLLTSVLSYLILRRGLLPVATMSRQAAQISPKNLSLRLSATDMPPDLRKLALACNNMLDRLEAGFRQLSQFSSDLAHELRTPVNILMGQTQVALAQARELEEYESLLESNLEEYARLARIIENILFLAHIDHAGFVLEKEPLSMAAEMGKLIDYFDILAQERDMHFAVDVGGIDGIIHANPLMLQRALSNLFINAIRHGQAGTVIQVKAIASSEGARISIVNQCAAIAQPQLDKMFDRFYRGDSARNSHTESNGLGLSIVKAIVDLHGGHVIVSYNKNEQAIALDLFFPG
ncbi:heavy metal sensor histidine kinase [Undibacterium sp. TC4M20W]|uniref:heavy metal sensor histidine kinase n=1 Tax=Undibacterium sp. TC4M20W TaxID=3413052 RepID=UPI003BF01BFA